jgi:uncharacterized glyoxalase superfamily protein PhnB
VTRVRAASPRGASTRSGAEILLEIGDQDYGGRDYTCRDLEGHVWTFGSCDPWRSER